jgi:hypothetical protein
MKVWKEKPSGAPKNDLGWDIVIQIGSSIHRSYFSNPAKSIDHVDLEYIRGRYPIVNTHKRAETFKRLYKQLFNENDWEIDYNGWIIPVKANSYPQAKYRAWKDFCGKMGYLPFGKFLIEARVA